MFGEVQSMNNKFITDVIKIQPVIEDKYSRVIPVDNIKGDALWQPTITKDGKHAVQINKSHPFYTKVYAPNIDSPVIIQGLDYLLWSLCEAELITINEFAQKNYQDLRYTAASKLEWLVKDLPDPDTDQDE